MKQITNFIKKYYPEILSIVIPILILTIAAIFCEMYPFGNYTFAKYDGYYQYPGFTSYFRRVLLGDANLFYSFKGLLGYNYYATAVYYMFNPTNLLSVFFDNNHIISYYTLIVYLRIALSGFTMCKYLRYKFKDKNNISLVIFSVAYALMAYNICYFFNYMYFDVVMIFPIVMIGLEKLINENKCGLYILSLSLSIISNFYIGYMVCIFSVLYFIYNYVLLEKRNKKIVKNFLISSILCGLIASIVLLPVIYELFQGKVNLYSDPSQTQYFLFNLNFLNIFYKSTPGSMGVADIKFGTVNIYCSLLVTIMVIKYFFNKMISKKEKIVTSIFIAFFLLSISFNLIDYFWHLMQRPIWYPNRYIFTFSFFLIVIAYKSFKYREHVNMYWLVKLIIVAVFILLMIYPAYNAVFKEKMYQGIAFIFSIMLLVEYTLFSENKNALLLIVLLFFAEITVNTIFTFKQLSNTSNISDFNFENSMHTTATDYIKSYDDSNSFYRLEFTKTMNYNNGAMYDYNGVSIFNSLRNGRIMNIFDKYLGFDVRDSASIVFNNYNPYILSILDIKYLNGNDNEDYYKLIYADNMPLYENGDALGLGFMVNKDVYNYKFVEDDSYYNTKEIVDTMLGSNNDVYKKLDNYEYHNTKKVYIEIGDTYRIKAILKKGEQSYTALKGVADESGFIIPNKKALFYTTVRATVNGKEADYYFKGNTMPIFVNKGDSYEIKFTSSNDYDPKYIEFYFYKYDAYINYVNEMKKNLMTINDYESDAHLNATVEATKEKSVLFTSIPYDKGWTVYVDNKKVNYDSCYNAFICLNLTEGKHNIEFKYVPSYFIEGSIISALSIIVSILFIRKKKSKSINTE